MTPARYKKILQMLMQRQADFTVVMENVHKAHNLAAIARTCDAVGIPEIHAITNFEELNLSEDAASGSGKWVNVDIHENIDSIYFKLRQKGFQLLTAHFTEQARDFREIDYTKPTAIVVGQELDGLSEKAINTADGSIIIPMYGMVQSLNVSVATAVILYEAQRQRFKAGMYENQKLSNEQIQKYLFEKGYPRLATLYNAEGKQYPIINENGEIID